MGAKNAIIQIMAYSVTCPACDEGQAHPGTGSFMWTPEEVSLDHKDGKLQCANCGAAIQIPKKYRGASK